VDQEGIETMVKLGIIGLGKWGQVLTSAAQKASDYSIVSGYSRSASTRDHFSQRFGIQCSDTAEAMLEDASIQGVILCVPNELHLPYAVMCAQAGKHIYIEKPITNQLADAHTLRAACEQHGVRVFIGHCAKLLSGVQRMKVAIEQGDLGEVCLIEGRFSNERALSLVPTDWRWHQDKAPGGPLSQIAIHQFDVLRYLGGAVTSVHAIAARKSPAQAQVEDQWVIGLKFVNGALGSINSSWTSPGVFEVRVVGTKGLMHYVIDQTMWGTAHRLHEGASLVWQKMGESPSKATSLNVDASDMFALELGLFVQLIQGTDQPNFDAVYGTEILAMVEAARLSDRWGGIGVSLDLKAVPIGA
jgi:predicted dehydrogenase